MAKFKIGDVVQLTSGGPKMTVVSLPDDQGIVKKRYYTCSWFAGSKNERASFPEEALEHPQAPQTPKKRDSE